MPNPDPQDISTYIAGNKGIDKLEKTKVCLRHNGDYITLYNPFHNITLEYRVYKRFRSRLRGESWGGWKDTTDEIRQLPPKQSKTITLKEGEIARWGRNEFTDEDIDIYLHKLINLDDEGSDIFIPPPVDDSDLPIPEGGMGGIMLVAVAVVVIFIIIIAMGRKG